MVRHMRIVAALAAALGIVALASGVAPAAPRKMGDRLEGLRKAPSFNVSGTFSGELKGVISLDGRLYRLSNDATLFEVGGGMLPAGTFVSGARVSFFGTIHDGTYVVRQVLIRRVADSTPREAATAGIGTVGADQPR